MYKIDLSEPKLRTLPRLLQLQALGNGNQRFLVDDHTSITFAEADERSNRLAGGLQQLGVRKGDNVALFLENRIEMVLLALAINKLQAIWVPINTDYKGDWLRSSIEDSQPRLLITQASLSDRLAASSSNIATGHTVLLDGTSDIAQNSFQQLLEAAPIDCDYDNIDYGDTCAILWTSGTTGKSKGVMVSHNNWLRPIIKGTSVLYKTQPGDIMMNVLPMYHAAAWNTAILRALVEGIPVVVENRFSVSSFWQRINHFNVTQSFTLGAMHMFLWNAPRSDNDADNTLRALQAVPMPADILPQFEQRFGLRILGSGYGQSECMMIISQAGHDTPAPEHSMGFAADDLEIRLFDDDDEEVTRGEVGEIRIRPLQPNIVCNGYFANPQASAEAWRGEWFCTGDMARMDESGAYYFSDRKKDAVRYAGRNISTLEVESVLRQHPAIADVAVYGIPSSELAEEDELKADIILQDGLQDEHDTSAEQLAEYVNSNAPYYFVPRYIEFLDVLPYTPTNKVQKFKLRERGVSEHTWDRIACGFTVKRG